MLRSIGLIIFILIKQSDKKNAKNEEQTLFKISLKSSRLWQNTFVKMMNHYTEFFFQFAFSEFARLRRTNFLRLCNGFHDVFYIYWFCFMTNMSQFSGEMDEISFAESSSIFDETNISKKVIICENVRQPVRTLFNQTLLLRGRQGLHSNQNTVFKPSRPLRRSQGVHCSQTLDFQANIVHTRQYPFLQENNWCDSI